MFRPPDPLSMPGSQESLAQSLARAVPLAGTPGEDYVERRGIPLVIANATGLRFAPDWGGRPAVVVALQDQHGTLVSVHGRYLCVARDQDKMLTIGPGGGLVSVQGGWRVDPLIVVEGLFDALTLGRFGFACAATIGRWVPWLAEVSVGRTVWLAFDAGRPGDAQFARYAAHLSGANVKRMLPPGRSKDWNTALLKRSTGTVESWVRHCLNQTR